MLYIFVITNSLCLSPAHFDSQIYTFDVHMIEPDKITRKQAKKLVSLLEQEARCEVMARMGRFDNLEYAEYAMKQIELKDEIRKMLFGTSDIATLAERWGMIGGKRKRRKRKSSRVRS